MAHRGLGLVHIYTGQGKGKTTSSMGLALRARGRGLSVKIIQLFKQSTGERLAMEELGIPYVQFRPLHPYFKEYSEPAFKDLQEVLLAFWQKETADLAAYDMVIIDEVGPALHGGVLSEEVVRDLVYGKPEGTELVLTGRDFPENIRDLADYVTEISSIKHPYEKGVLARRGIEF